MHHLNHLGNNLVRHLDLFSQGGSAGPSDIDAFIFKLAIDGYSFARLFAAFLLNIRPVPCQAMLIQMSPQNLPVGLCIICGIGHSVIMAYPL